MREIDVDVKDYIRGGLPQGLLRLVRHYVDSGAKAVDFDESEKTAYLRFIDSKSAMYVLVYVKGGHFTSLYKLEEVIK